jgi:D-alanyl-D-alanine-carboxypeptidase/D-alanyl-D-alanine-endopeptidase
MPRSKPAPCTRASCCRVLAALLITLPLASMAGEFNLKKTEKIMTQLIERSMQERGVASTSVALVKDDQIVWKAAFGYSNLRTKTLATPDTIYSTGSTFKSVTATALMQLQEQGKLSLDHPINRYLGENRVQDRLQSDIEVNFHHLLSGWSGLLPGASVEPIWGRELPATLEEFTAKLYSIRAPETKWEYNNFAYGTAGLLVQEISGQEYEEYVVEHILKPLGVTTPHPAYPSPDMVEVMALPYSAGGSRGTPTPVGQVHFDVYPAGDLYLTAEDMARYLGAHLNGGVFNGQRILSEASVKDMHTNRFGGDYALGFWVEKDENNGHTIIQHGGSIPGHRSMLRGDVDAKVGIYYMTNSDVEMPIDHAALALLRGDDYELPPKRVGQKVDGKILDEYAGTYTSPEGIAVTFTRDGADLISKSGNSVTELLAESDTRFYYAPFNSVITFVKDEAGVVDRLELSLNGRSYSAKRQR